MFGLFSRKNEPLSLEGTATVGAPARIVFSLVDFASPQCRLLARGFEFSERTARRGRFTAHDPDMPGLRFEFEVDTYEEPAAYGYVSRIFSDEPVGAFERMREEYRIEALGAQTCRVTVRTKNWWRDTVKRRDRRHQEASMTEAVMRDLAKLKLEAETLASESAD